MAAKRKKGGGGKLTRSEVVTVRLDPKLRFGAELAARRQRRTLSSFIEYAVEQMLAQIPITHAENPDESLTAKQVIDSIWDVDEADRFVLLALSHPELLNHHEEILWKLLTECEGLWISKNQRFVNTAKYKVIRKYWDTLNKVAIGDLAESQIPDEVKNFIEQDGKE